TDRLSEDCRKVSTHIHQYGTARPLATRLRKIIANTAIDYYRPSMKFAQQEDVDEYEHIGGEDENVYGKLAYDELLSLIRSLTPAYQTVFNLYAIDGYSHQEIATMLGITVNTSKSNLHKARKRLQELLQQTAKNENRDTRTGTSSRSTG